MGSGKTTIGKLLAEMLDLNFIDVDLFIEERYHKTIGELFEEYGEARFREIEKNTLREISEFEDIVISTGGGAPCFSDNMDFMNTQGVTVFLNVSPKRLFERLKKAKQKRPLLRDKTDEELIDFITRTLEKRAVYYERAHIIHNAEDLGTDTDKKITTELLSKKLRSYCE